MAASSNSKKDKKDKSKNKSIEFSLDTLSKSKHGLACVANIDVRGNVSICALFKRSRKDAKPAFDYASILGYVGGEFRDGFSQTNLEESEAVRFLQSQISSLEEKRIGLAFGAVEDVAGLVLLPLHTKSVKKGFGFPDTETADAFEYFNQVAQFCRYTCPEDFFRIKLRGMSGRDITKARDRLTADLQLWSIDAVEIEFHKCPFPPDPPNWPSSSGRFADCDELPGFLQQAGWVLKAYEDAEDWKKTAASKLSTPDNYERFTAMAKHQAMWYIWKGDLEKSAVMVHSWRRLDEDWKKGNPLDPKNPAIDVILNVTHNDLSNAGLYKGYPKPDARLLRDNKCDVCASPVYEIDLKSFRERYGRTCVDRDGNAEVGSEDVRDNMAKLLFAIFKFGSNHDFETSAMHCFKEALHVFLAHSFNNFYWRIKPTKPMKEAVETDCIPGFVNLLSNKAKGELDVSTFSSSCESILKTAMLKQCSSKLGEDQIKSVCDLFRLRLGLIVYDFHKIAADDGKEEKAAGGESAKDVGVDLLSKTMIPSFATEFQGKWTLLPEVKRQKILTTDSKALIKTCDETFEKIKKIYGRQKKNLQAQGVEEITNQNDSTSDYNCGNEKNAINTDGCSEPFVEPKLKSENDLIPDVCSDDSCPCKDPDKFFKHFVAILSSDDNPVPFYKCALTGDVIMNEEMCLDQDGSNVGRMAAFDFEHINSTINSIDNEKFSSCPRLGLLCKRVCQNIYPLIVMSLCQGFVELQKKDSSKAELHTCPNCGQVEGKPGEFKRCGGCKNVYYCGRKCQVRDWKAGHKQECEATAKQA